MKFIALAVCLGMLAGCASQPKTADVKDEIEKSLRDAGYKDVKVSQDREKGVVTLGGQVQSQEDKDRAEAIAKGGAAGQVVANEVGVIPPASARIAKQVNADEDKAIEKNLDAAFASAGLKGVKHRTKNGVVTLTGAVPGEATRSQAALAAEQIANVQQVVNEIETTLNRATSSN